MKKGLIERAMVALRRLDLPLVVIASLISLLSVINLRSASMHVAASYHISQIMWFGVGVALAVGVAVMETRFIKRGALFFYGVVIVLLAAVALVGTEINNSQRWLNLGVFMVQPSELLKLAVIVMTASFFDDRQKEEGYHLHELWKPAGLVLVGVLFVMNQPDLGTSLLILAIFATMVLFEGLRWESMVMLGLAVVVALPLGYSLVLQDYQQDRVRSFLNIEADAQGQSWQVRQSMIAFGSGQVWGRGHGQGTQIQKGFVPEHQNDFIAAHWAEERGFVGMVGLLMLYFALIAAILNISRKASTRFGVLIGVGMAAMIFWHVLVNLGMVLGVLPVVGLTLPIMSYGGSSLLVILIGFGLLLNLGIHRRPGI